MPALRRFLAHTLPGCFDSEENTTSLHGEAHKLPDAQPHAKEGNKKRSTLPDSLFVTTIMRTVDTRISSTKAEDDEMELVEMGRNKGATESDTNASKATSDTEKSYKSKYKTVLPEER